jgi:protease YdgD
MRYLAAMSLALLLALPITQASAQKIEKPVLPGIGGYDNRAPVKPDTPPWRGLGRLQANAGNLHMSCTATLVAPRLLITAAHCLYNPRTQAYFRAAELHFLLGYTRGAFVAHALGIRVTIGTGYDPKRPATSIGSDWALVTIDQALGTPDRVLRLIDEPLQAGRGAMVGGYSQDFVELITADSSCRIIRLDTDAGGHRYMQHDCATTFGDSGAPLLVRDGTSWRIAGIANRAGRGEVGGAAAGIDEARQAIGDQSPKG